MSSRSGVVAWVVSVALVACSAGSEHGPTDSAEGSMDGGIDGSTSDLKVPGDSIAVGDQVDIDGDGTADGVAVDVNADGVADGVDSNGDGTVDVALPSDSVDGATLLSLPDAGASPFPVNAAGQVLCGGSPCACSDGKDGDGDGLIDLADPECVASWDNDEASFATGIPGDNRDDACQDCFFDGNSGSGNDGCRLPSSCLREGNNSSGRGSCKSCDQTLQCKTFCQAYTPNGCDCFGCCGVHLENGSVVNVALGAGCNIDGNNVQGCQTCVPNDSCRNECGKCELCPGKTLADLPADCFANPGGSDGGVMSQVDGGAVVATGDAGAPQGGGGGTPGYTCDQGATRCGDGLATCADGASCEFGCCVLVPILL